MRMLLPTLALLVLYLPPADAQTVAAKPAAKSAAKPAPASAANPAPSPAPAKGVYAAMTAEYHRSTTHEGRRP